MAAASTETEKNLKNPLLTGGEEDLLDFENPRVFDDMPAFAKDPKGTEFVDETAAKTENDEDSIDVENPPVLHEMVVVATDLVKTDITKEKPMSSLSVDASAEGGERADETTHCVAKVLNYVPGTTRGDKIGIVTLIGIAIVFGTLWFLKDVIRCLLEHGEGSVERRLMESRSDCFKITKQAQRSKKKVPQAQRSKKMDSQAQNSKKKVPQAVGKFREEVAKKLKKLDELGNTVPEHLRTALQEDSNVQCWLHRYLAKQWADDKTTPEYAAKRYVDDQMQVEQLKQLDPKVEQLKQLDPKAHGNWKRFQEASAKAPEFRKEVANKLDELVDTVPENLRTAWNKALQEDSNVQCWWDRYKEDFHTLGKDPSSSDFFEVFVPYAAAQYVEHQQVDKFLKDIEELFPLLPVEASLAVPAALDVLDEDMKFDTSDPNRAKRWVRCQHCRPVEEFEKQVQKLREDLVAKPGYEADLYDLEFCKRTFVAVFQHKGITVDKFLENQKRMTVASQPFEQNALLVNGQKRMTVASQPFEQNALLVNGQKRMTVASQPFEQNALLVNGQAMSTNAQDPDLPLNLAMGPEDHYAQFIKSEEVKKHMNQPEVQAIWKQHHDQNTHFGQMQARNPAE